MTTILTVFGTRPEAIKMAPVIDALRALPRSVRCVTCSTGQHDEMLQQMLELFRLSVDYDLHVMRRNQTLAALTAALLRGIDAVLVKTKPSWVLAQGDTTTAFTAALAAHYHKIPFGHVEAGLRTRNKFHPFPEEMNRRLADCLADLYFAPTSRARQNLLTEGFADQDVLVTGNTVVDALRTVAAMDADWSVRPLALVPRDRRLVLVTAHRRENIGEGLNQICLAIRLLAQEFGPSGVQFVFPVHLNPNVRQAVHRSLDRTPAVTLLEPLDYASLVQILRRSELVLTDSGGLQEEAPTFRVPVLVMRETTERPEGLEAGIARLVGTNHEVIVAHTRDLLTNPEKRAAMAAPANPYGDGQAGQRIAAAVLSRRV
jgi:UDP-N-acetylglucosamine 2-epimerase (non-hydrolysing)